MIGFFFSCLCMDILSLVNWFRVNPYLHLGTLHLGTLHLGTLHLGTLHLGTLHLGTERICLLGFC